jgi:hypothetical protein
MHYMLMTTSAETGAAARAGAQAKAGMYFVPPTFSMLYVYGRWAWLPAITS